MPDLFIGNPETHEQIRKGVRAGTLRRIAKDVYVPQALSETQLIPLLRTQWAQVVGALAPDAVVTDRTAIEKRPFVVPETNVAHVYLSSPSYRDAISLPGLDIHRREGTGPVEGDTPFLGTFLAQPARQYLDNLVPSRTRNGARATLTTEEIERRLTRMLSHDGTEGLNSLRDKARLIAPSINRESEFQKLEAIIGALLRTRDAAGLRTKVAQATAEGRAYDEDAVRRFALLADELKAHAPYRIENRDRTEQGHIAGCFIEAYFSNYIEGTRFLVDEAEEIAIKGAIPADRPEDGRDVRGTYLELLESRPGLSPASSGSFEGLVQEVKDRHARVMAGRPDLKPGTFKGRPNQAGNTTFVHPQLVMGTLGAGFEILKTLAPGFSRAVFMHYLLAEVHPFNDGNGRLSRIMMTRELMSEGLSRIVIPTVYRDDYLGVLRSLSRNDRPLPIIKALEFCQLVAQDCSAADLRTVIENWARAYAFCEDVTKARLRRPDFRSDLLERDGVLAPSDYWEADYGPGIGR